MGKTYKAQPDLYDADDLFDEELEDALDFEDDMDLYLNKQMALSASRRSRGRRGHRRSADYLDYDDAHRLPRDWQDFDYTSDTYQDDWR